MKTPLVRRINIMKPSETSTQKKIDETRKAITDRNRRLAEKVMRGFRDKPELLKEQSADPDSVVVCPIQDENIKNLSISELSHRILESEKQWLKQHYPDSLLVLFQRQLLPWKFESKDTVVTPACLPSTPQLKREEI